MKRYNIVNNSLGWLCFLIAAVTYLMTVEPTASFWDCPEFIAQGAKLEVGHPPGNPVFMLAARFCVNFVGGDSSQVALAVNCMSALLSAATILLLFWTITHLVRRLLVKDGEEHVSLPRMIAIMGSGLCGALCYTWSDTFWFSAVEGEVYAFSSFCTALVFWLILKWENRADQPHSDRYLILIAYVIGISIAVHLLNLLCIPAIVLVIYYRKFANPTATGSLLALGVSAVIVGLILYGLVPGFIEIAGYFELFCVNVLGMSFNMGVLIYFLIFMSVMIWCLYSIYSNRSTATRLSFALTVLLSGILFIGNSLWVPALLMIAVLVYLLAVKVLPMRVMAISALSILVIFIGYSSYALLLIRAEANPPMNQNAPDNVFALASYLNREQYGDRPLFVGQSFGSQRVVKVESDGSASYLIDEGPKTYIKALKENPDDPDRYISKPGAPTLHYTPTMLFPRMYSTGDKHPEQYMDWAGISQRDLETRQAAVYVDSKGNPYNGYEMDVKVPTMAQNLRFFVNYQFNHMYWRYFMWNFAGRQNDLQGNGELNRGNWISGIPLIDNARLGDQSLLPPDQGTDNPGHNVFYMLPLLLGVIGLVWQSICDKCGIEQFWVIFFLFFMTGIAIVLYLNQTPLQPRERDYAYAGSFYAFAIWVGMGVAALWRIGLRLSGVKDGADADRGTLSLVVASVAAVIGIAVPLQMVSQTWDDHDRSGRYTTRDYGRNYLSSLDENAIIFTNGDNDTFPLWYNQEVEGYRTDVRVVNLSYLTTDWYANQMRIPSYNADGIAMQAEPRDYYNDRIQASSFGKGPESEKYVDVFASLDDLYHNTPADGYSVMKYPRVKIPSNIEGAVKAGVITEREAQDADTVILADLTYKSPYATLSNVLSLDMIATSAANDWNRPAYFAVTVPDNYYLGLSDNLRSTGLAYQVTPVHTHIDGYGWGVDTDKMYRNVTERFRWGGLDSVPEGKTVYLDETVRRMVSTHRGALYDLAEALYNEGVEANAATDSVYAADRFDKAVRIMEIMDSKLPVRFAPYAVQDSERIGSIYVDLGRVTGRADLEDKGRGILRDEILRYGLYIPYYRSLVEREGGLIVGSQSSLNVHHLNLSDIDRYVPILLTNLLQAYMSAGGDVEEVDATLAGMGVNIDDIIPLSGAYK